ncbi:MAG: ABC transporter substrate-binding protein [Lachnospiraceae bacterium]|nr:ABC transporter substrate-binding protein [Lachnospiraceae bacterium]MDY4970801.1 ABC transporter substrate-binding protein [Lachnospiraceae bacterium]
MFKKVLSLALAGAMVLSLAACGGKDSGSSDGGDAAETFKIGSIGPATGAYAIYGLGVKNGAQIAVDEINEAGGINGYKVEFKFEDDEVDNEKSVNAYNTLKDWGMQILAGTVTSGCCTAVGAETANDNMFQITPSGSSTDSIDGRDNVFQVCFTDPNQGIASAQYIGEHGLASKVAAIYDSSDVYSSGIYAKFKEEAKNQPFEIVAEGSFTGDNKTDFSVPLQQAKDAGAELVFLPIYYQEAALILAQADSMGYDPTFFGCDGMDGILGVENFDTSLAEGLMLLTPFAADAEDEMTQKFVETYKKNNNDETPNQFAADAYDAIYAIKAAIEEADVKPSDSVSDICDAMKAAMVKINVKGLTSDEGGMTWSETGEVSKAPKAVVIQDGKYVSAQ